MIDVITVFDCFGGRIADIAFDAYGDAGVGAGIMTAILEFCNDSGQEDSLLYAKSSHIGYVCGVNRSHELIVELHKESGTATIGIAHLDDVEKLRLDIAQEYDLRILSEVGLYGE